jgi:hypothetical protein
MNLRHQLEQLERTVEVAKERRAARYRAYARTLSDVQLLALLWRVPEDRIPPEIGGWPREHQRRFLEQLRAEVQGK